MLKGELPQAVQQALAELRLSLEQIYGPRFRGLYLYGSHARGDYRADSDVDLLIVLKGEVNPCAEINRLSELVSDLCLRYDLLIAVFPVPEAWLQNRQSPLFKNIRREGILL
ncbi:MAG: nucleotidyltransferase domain-containing protein [Desulfobacca sp.]|nr:nucleotidyltransferase domain-containing protein [Desulfobacca sp.]